MRIIPRARISYCDGSNAPGRRRAYAAFGIALPKLAAISRGMFITVAACCFLLQCVAASAAEREKTPASPEERFLHDAPGKLAGLTFTRADVKQCETYLKQADAVSKHKFALILARYRRLLERDPVAALEFLGPFVTDKDRIKEWAQAQEQGCKEAVAKWKEELRCADKEKKELLENDKPNGLFAPFPPPNLWQVDFKNVDLAIEIARCLMDLHRYQEAMAIIDSLGKKYTGDTLVLSAECGAELLIKMQLYQKGIDFYYFALKALDSLKSPGAGFTPEQQIINARLQRGLAEAKRLLEIEQYGAGWVAYRDAERTRRDEGNFLSAYLQYQDLQRDFAKTVYAEAGSAYSVHCLLELANVENMDKVKETIAKLGKELAEEKRRLAQFKKSDLPKPALQELADQAKLHEERLARLQAVPAGDAALALAEKNAQAFFNEDPTGLYRGEVLAALARARMDIFGQAKAGFEAYHKLSDWLTQVAGLQKALDGFTVPEQAATVAKPPETENNLTGWAGEITKRDIPIGAIVNRLNCPWYLDSLHAECAKMLCFEAFLNKDTELGKKLMNEAIRYDKLEREFKEDGAPNFYSRLQFIFNKGYIDYPADHAEAFKGDLRTMFLLGDFYFLLEDEARCLAVRRRLVENRYGKLTPEQAGNAKYRLAGIYYRRMEFEPARKTLADIIENHSGTNAAAWACIGMGNYYIQLPDLKEQRQCVGYYEQALTLKCLNSADRERAMFYLARAYQVTDNAKAALKTFTQTLRKYPDGVYSDLCEKYIGQLNGIENKEGGE